MKPDNFDSGNVGRFRSWKYKECERHIYAFVVNRIILFDKLLTLLVICYCGSGVPIWSGILGVDTVKYGTNIAVTKLKYFLTNYDNLQKWISLPFNTAEEIHP